MLTKDDFAKIASLFGPIRRDLLGIRIRLTNIEKEVAQLENTTKKNHKEVIAKLKKTSDFLDRENLKTLNRVERIETHLGLSPD